MSDIYAAAAKDFFATSPAPRKLGKSAALAAPYGNPAPAKGFRFIGVDLAKDRDQAGAAIVTRSGTQVVMIAGETTTIDRHWIDGLNANRKADREALAMAFTMIATMRGASVERREVEANPGFRGASIHLEFKVGGVGVMIDLDNLHGGAGALAHWYNDAPERGKSQNFSTSFGLKVKDHGTICGRGPFHKATSNGASWFDLAMMIDSGLCLAARSEAFQQPSAS